MKGEIIYSNIIMIKQYLILIYKLLFNWEEYKNMSIGIDEFVISDHAVKSFLGIEYSLTATIIASCIFDDSALIKNVKLNFMKGYDKITINIFWEDEPCFISDFRAKGLHGTYNTDFQKFILENKNLIIINNNGKRLKVLLKEVLSIH